MLTIIAIMVAKLAAVGFVFVIEIIGPMKIVCSFDQLVVVMSPLFWYLFSELELVLVLMFWRLG